MYDVNKNTAPDNIAFSRVGVKISNGIPQILKERPKKAFKRSLKEMLLDILETERLLY